MSKFRILCEVSGGVTGNRSGYFKQKGVVVICHSRAEAKAWVEQLRSKAQSGADYGNTANYCYTVERYLTGDELLATHRYTGQSALDLD